ncbi:hypothetical protein PIB30_005010 [Stylosanthes scabra]|uniref:Transposase MuDR plant domain-containing protein n=1 Tax=Stylosanthes scabra TaxID=79078 RepID=A0ABU6Y3Z8_9FABA|nr:hypothetical protein [Stylosanthes scabra]
MEAKKTNHESTPHGDNHNNLHDSQGVNVSSIDGQNPLPLVPCATQLVPTSQDISGSAKWNDLIKEEWQIFQNTSELSRALLEYGIAHKFTYKFLKNNPDKIICVCKVEDVPWKLSVYAMKKRVLHFS